MAVNVQELLVKISGDNTGFKSALGESVESTEGFNTSLLGIAAVATAAFAAVAEGMKYALEQYKESEDASNRLTLSLQNQGLYSDTLFKSYKSMAEELQKLTGIDNDAIVKGQASLQSMIGRTEITKEMTTAAVNLGAALGGNVNDGFSTLGRAIDGNTRGLKVLGIEIDQNLSREERTHQILEKINVAYGGLAETQNKGLGSTKGLGTAVADLAKDFGEDLAPSVSKAIGYLTDFFTGMHEQMQKAKDPITQVDKQIENLTVSVEALKSHSSDAMSGLDATQQVEALKQANAQLDILKAKRDDLMKAGRGSSVSQDPRKEAEAKRQEALRRDRDQREQAALRGHNAALEASVTEHTKTVVDLYKQEAELETQIADDKNARIRSQLEGHLQVVRDMRIEALSQEKEQQSTFNEEFAQLKGQQYEMTLQETENFLEHDRQNLESSIMTESSTRRKATVDELTQQIKAHNDYLAAEAKYGKTYATINKMMHSEVYEGSAKAFGDLAQLQQSSNSTLKTIGQIAAVANIVIKTAESAMNIYTGFSTIPIIGPELGVIGAAAAVAFGAEQVGKVMGAAKGGLISGGIPGVDSVPVLAQQGELIAPASNFEEVVTSVAARRAAEQTGAGFGSGGAMELIIGFKDNAFEIIEQKILERRAIGTGAL